MLKLLHMLDVNHAALVSGIFLVGDSDTSDLRIESFLWTSCGFCGFVAKGNDSGMAGIHVKVLVNVLQGSVRSLWV